MVELLCHRVHGKEWRGSCVPPRSVEERLEPPVPPAVALEVNCLIIMPFRLVRATKGRRRKWIGCRALALVELNIINYLFGAYASL